MPGDLAGLKIGVPSVTTDHSPLEISPDPGLQKVFIPINTLGVVCARAVASVTLGMIKGMRLPKEHPGTWLSSVTSMENGRLFVKGGIDSNIFN